MLYYRSPQLIPFRKSMVVQDSAPQYYWPGCRRHKTPNTRNGYWLWCRGLFTDWLTRNSIPQQPQQVSRALRTAQTVQLGVSHERFPPVWDVKQSPLEGVTSDKGITCGQASFLCYFEMDQPCGEPEWT